MRSQRWKWIGLGAVAAIAAGTVFAAERRRRRWREYDTDEIRTRLHERFAALDPPAGSTGRVNRRERPPAARG